MCNQMDDVKLNCDSIAILGIIKLELLALNSNK